MEADVTVIGGGPSGLMAAIAAAEQGAKTILVDKGNKLGKKLAISGGGRCNVTNRLPKEEIINHIPGNGRFLYSGFSIFDNYDIIDFFEGLGVSLKEEDHGRMFPVSNKASDVVNALLDQLNQLNIIIKKNTKVQAIHFDENEHILLLENSNKIKTQSVVLATGGKAVPHTGSTGDAYPWAKKAGHTITELYPTEVPIVSKETFITEKLLQGTSLRNVALSVFDHNNKKIITHQMDMLFTHFGISGPAVLRCSQFIVKLLMQDHTSAKVHIDSLADLTSQEIQDDLLNNIHIHTKKSFKNVVKGMLPERYLDFLLHKANIDREIKCANISREKLNDFIKLLKGFSFNVHGYLPMEKAFVTGGGVSIKEVVPSTMQSKLMHRLFFCGEVLDIHGYTGGYNITAAMITGRIAGMNAAWQSFS